MAKYNLYVFHDDESATLFDYPISTTDDPNQNELTEEQEIDLAVRCANNQFHSFTREQIKNWSSAMRTTARWDFGSLIFDTIAIVPVEHENTLRVLGNALFESFGDDSSTYRAVETFNSVLKDLAVSTFKIDCDYGDEDLSKYS